MLIAAAACEMHPTAVLRGAELRSIGEQLQATTAAAAAAGVSDVPAIVVGTHVFAARRCERGRAHAAATHDRSARRRV